MQVNVTVVSLRVRTDSIAINRPGARPHSPACRDVSIGFMRATPDQVQQKGRKSRKTTSSFHDFKWLVVSISFSAPIFLHAEMGRCLPSSVAPTGLNPVDNFGGSPDILRSTIHGSADSAAL